MLICKAAPTMIANVCDPNTAQIDAIETLLNMIHNNTMGPVSAMAWTPTSMHMVTGHAEEKGLVRYWSAKSGTLLMVMQGHQGKVTSVATSPTADRALSGGEDGTIRLWDLDTGRQLLLLDQIAGGSVRALKFIPGGATAVSGSDDGFVRLWDLEKAKITHTIATSLEPVNSIAVNPSNPLGQLLVACGDGPIRVYEREYTSR